ncbi:MAG: energy transducer TonB [Chitinophagaceae bacterium]|nr:energy transducer TonB [Chitinophagaceae bacterium]
MEQTLNPLVPYEHHAPPGTYKVTVRFYVDENGQLSQFQPVTAHGYGMEEEVIRFLKKSPAWLPARQNGKKTGAFAEQSVNFAVEYDFSLSTYQLKAGQKNRLSVSLTKGKPGEIEIELTDAQITLISPGHFEIIPSKKGKALLTVYERKSKTMKYELGKVWMDIQ